MTVRGHSVGGGIAIGTFLTLAVLGLLAFLGGLDYLAALIQRLERLGAWGPLLFILLDMLVVILLLPGLPLTLASGFLFGVFYGTVYVVAGTALGAVIAFTLARYAFGARAAGFLKSHSRVRALDRAFAQEGWRVVLLTRVVPFFPFKLSNYLFGLSRFSMRDFTFGTLFGIVPITVNNVYIGSLAADVTNLLSGNRPPAVSTVVLSAVGLVVAIFAVVYLRKVARRALGSELGYEDVTG